MYFYKYTYHIRNNIHQMSSTSQDQDDYEQ